MKHNIKLESIYYILSIILIFVLYEIGAFIGIQTSFTTNKTSLFWPPSGICLAILLRYGKKYFPGIFLAAFINNLNTNLLSSFFPAFITAIGKTLSPYCGATLLNQRGFRTDFSRQQDVVNFLIFGVFASSVISPLFGSLVYMYLRNLTFFEWSHTFLIWWMGDLMGVLLISPLILCWQWRFKEIRFNQKLIEFIILFLIFIIFCLVLFDQRFTFINSLPIAFLPYAILIWFSVRFGVQIVILMSFILSVFAIWGTAHKIGPLFYNNLNTSLLLIWLYVGVIMITSLLMNAIKKEKNTLLWDLKSNLKREQILNEELGRQEEELSRQLSYSKDLNSQLDSKVQELHQVTHELENKNQALIKTNKELDRFVYSASHDLRSPIASCLGLINVALEENEVQEIKKYLILQQKSLNKLDHFIKDLIDFSKNSKIELINEPINLPQLIQEVFEQHSFMDKSSQIAKLVDIDDKIQFSSDPNRLKIILNNLIANAIRYHQPYRENPYVKVVVKELTEKSVLIQVEDNGIGIQNEHLDRVFEMFYRATNEKEVGSGLGLYIVKETVEKLGGSINIHSQYDEWTKVELILPNFQG